jgi:hypothetical protein
MTLFMGKGAFRPLHAPCNNAVICMEWSPVLNFGLFGTLATPIGWCVALPFVLYINTLVS